MPAISNDMIALQNYPLRLVAALLLWLALVLWGSAIVNYFPALSAVTTQAYRILASAIAPFVLVSAFWVHNPRNALGTGIILVLSGGIALAMQP
ncbi:hypothetical protein [Acetobacter syzygii]|uniref:hypothetical protein n=1 Tax=Acetobacter syzygii TaxID=146476 RepID=UPI001571580E|nr:hypothetical protein [Acetobacter syzygii]NSL93082.1 hypothetical protein [Acetobacter syzygii]